MSLKSFAAKLFAKHVAKKTAKWVSDPLVTQDRVFKELIANAKTPYSGRTINFQG